MAPFIALEAERQKIVLRGNDKIGFFGYKRSVKNPIF
jgi:hypothetical protein